MKTNTRFQERGVETGIQAIYRDMEYAKSLILRKVGKNGAGASGSENPTGETDADEDDVQEEAWTFVGGDEPDPDMVTKKLSEIVGVTTEALPAGLRDQVLQG